MSAHLSHEDVCRDEEDLAIRIRAVLRLISPDDITPMGVRQIEAVLNKETSWPSSR